MSSLSEAAANATLDAWFGATTLGPATWYVAFFTSTVTEGSAGTEVSTGTWTNYARKAVTNNATNFPAASSKAKSNGTAIDFGSATIPSGTVTIQAVGLYDASSGGNLKFSKNLTASKVINGGDTVTIAIGDLDITA